MVTRRAVVEWLSKEEGGRREPPSGTGPTPYITEVRLVDPKATWPDDVAWSLVVEKDEGESSPYRWSADVSFLAFEAPHEALRPPCLFELYEGRRCVARGKIVGDSEDRSKANATVATLNRR